MEALGTQHIPVFAKIHSTAFVLTAVIVAMLVEWQVSTMFRKTKAQEEDVHRHYHGLCNRGVGQPYTEFTHQLRVLSERGDAAALARALHEADEHSGDIYRVWLDDDDTAYRTSIQQALR